jgi:hypothetical protein
VHTVPSTHTPVAASHTAAHAALIAAVEELPLPLAHVLRIILDGLDLAAEVVDAAPVIYPDTDPRARELRVIFREQAMTSALMSYRRALALIDDRFPDEVGDLTAPRSA